MLVRKCDNCKKETKKENAEVVVGLGWPTYSFCTRCGKPIIAFLKKRFFSHGRLGSSAMAMSVQDRIDVVSFSFYGLLLNERRRETASLNHGVW